MSGMADANQGMVINSDQRGPNFTKMVAVPMKLAKLSTLEMLGLRAQLGGQGD